MWILESSADWAKWVTRGAADMPRCEAGDWSIVVILIYLNRISTELPSGDGGSLTVVCSADCPPRDQSQLPAHKSYFMPATLLKRQDKSPICKAAALAYCVDNHREMSETKAKRNSVAPKTMKQQHGEVQSETVSWRGNFLRADGQRGQQKSEQVERFVSFHMFYL